MMSGKFDINKIQVSRPCSADWESMAGNDRMRFCTECEKHVFNLSQMTPREIKSLVLETGGKFCARVTRDADGSVVTSSPQVRFNILKLRVPKIATAVISATLTFGQNIMAQSTPTPCSAGKVQTVRQSREAINQTTSDSRGRIKGVVSDVQKAVIQGAMIKVKNKRTGEEFLALSSLDGDFSIGPLPLGTYDLSISAQGFVTSRIDNVNINSPETLNLEFQIELNVGSQGGVVYVEEFIEAVPLSERLLTPIKIIKEIVKKPQK
jgi:hypothetical protein